MVCREGIPSCEFDNTGTITSFNTVGANGLLATAAKSGSSYSPTYYAFDFRGNTVNLFSSSSSVLANTTYKAYNNRNSDATYGLPYEGFGGQFGCYKDFDNIYLMGQRYYAMSQGRWLSRDPIGYAGGINVYSYAGNNPINAVDPSGLDWRDNVIGAGKAVLAWTGNAINAPFRWAWAGIKRLTAPKMSENVCTLGHPYLDPDTPETYEVNGRYQRAGRAINEYIDDTAVTVMQTVAFSGAAGRLRPLGDSVWESSGGLRFGVGPQGHRLAHVMEHLEANPLKPIHSVFSVNGSLIDLLDEGWAARTGPGVLSNGNRAFTVPMGRPIGTLGETNLVIVVKDGTTNVITAYPKF